VADDKGETMTIKINETDLLDLLGENGERWVQRDWGDADSMCLHGAIRRCSPQPGDAFIIEQVAAFQGWGTDWNDSDDTDWEMVRARLAHVEVTDADLADTFGPQWKHIVALVRRAAILTKDETRQLLAAWDAAGVTAWVTACVAAEVAARDTARRVTWDAARDAALALSVRDLIGQSGFTQEHYDLLTGPWRSVIGSVHPDDAPMEARRG